MRIRAQQGHSQRIAARIDDNALLKRLSTPPPVCVHGTYLRNLEAIRAQGLRLLPFILPPFSRADTMIKIRVLGPSRNMSETLFWPPW